MGNILEINKLVKRYIGFKLGEISLTLEPGTILGIVGPNGAGKTTLIKSILGMAVKESGDIKVFGKDLATDGVEIRDRIGFVSIEMIAVLKGLITPKIFGKTYGRYYSKWNEKKYHEYLERFEIPASKSIGKLSQGMKMKVSLAFALSHDAELLILDEPTAGLDPIFREEILDILLAEIEDSNKSIIISTHITSDLDKCADYLLVMNEGEKLLMGTKDEIIESHSLVKADKSVLNPELKKLFVNIRENKFGFEGLTNQLQDIAQLMTTDYVVERPRVEDIMYYYCKK
jgi:ABC-2 type transport system ATP-binding protein